MWIKIKVMKHDSLSKKVLTGILLAGAIYIAASSPYFSIHLIKNIERELRKRKHLKEKYKDKTFNNSFYYLKRKGYLNIEKKNKQIYISLTKKGEETAGKYLIDDLEIKKPKKWDGKWRIVIFDIPNLTNIKRASLRGKLKQLGFYKLQHSVWTQPYYCQREMKTLKEFFGLNEKEFKLITGEIENDKSLRKIFNL